MEPYRTETVDTPAGEYTVELHYDQDAPNPLTEYDQEGMAFYIVSRDVHMNNLVDVAGEPGAALKELIDRHGYRGTGQDGMDAVERRYRKWAAIAGSPWILVHGSDYDNYDGYRWYVLVDTSATYVASDGKSYPLLPQPVAAAKSTMEAYRKYAAGEFTGYVVKDPSGEVVESVWGFDDEDYALEQGKEVVDGDIEQRLDAANRAGAGFVGIV